MSRRAMVVQTVGLGEIVVGHRLRAGVNEEAVSRLVDSIERVGLRTPISVRHVEEWTDPETGEQVSGALELVAGRHRLEALRRMGATTAPVVMVQDETEARLWEISENLHRAELSPVERAEHIDEWRRLTVEKVTQVASPLPGGVQPRDRGHQKTADALGLSHDTVRRAEKIAALPKDVRDTARTEGWTQDRLLREAAPTRVEPARPVKPAPGILNDFETEEAWRGAMNRVWNRGSAEWRERWLDGAERSVFDTTGAGGAV